MPRYTETDTKVTFADQEGLRVRDPLRFLLSRVEGFDSNIRQACESVHHPVKMLSEGSTGTRRIALDQTSQQDNALRN